MKEQGANSSKQPKHGLRLAGRIAHGFHRFEADALVIVAALLLGAFSILETPREEEPQIVVPMLDVFVQMPAPRRKKFRSGSVFPWRSSCARFPVSNMCIR
jgi:Cation/multidrug efflux pump